MRTLDAIGHFKNKASLAKAFTPPLTRGAISQWGEVVPRGRAFELESITQGKLKVDFSLYEQSEQPKSAA